MMWDMVWHMAYDINTNAMHAMLCATWDMLHAICQRLFLYPMCCMLYALWYVTCYNTSHNHHTSCELYNVAWYDMTWHLAHTPRTHSMRNGRAQVQDFRASTQGQQTLPIGGDIPETSRHPKEILASNDLSMQTLVWQMPNSFSLATGEMSGLCWRQTLSIQRDTAAWWCICMDG